MEHIRIKKCLFGAVLTVFSLALLEIAILVAYVIVKQSAFPYTKYSTWIHSIALCTQDFDAPGALRGGNEIVHPYFGFTYNPNGRNISDYGFIDPRLQPPVIARTNGLIVAVLGGSFATHTCVYAAQTLVEQLRVIDDPVRIVNLALGGYKQPQQLIILTYLLSLGAHFDLVINIDGFNEVVLPTAENLPNGVFPLYPRDWRLRMANIHEPEMSMKLLRLDAIRARKRHIAAFFDRSLLSRLALGCMVWRALDRSMERSEYEASSLIEATRADARPIVTGPPFNLQTDKQIYSYLVDHWARCSLMLNELCLTRGILYFHFLQPNQYLVGSKPIGTAEAKIAIDLNHGYRPGVIAGYPMLRERGQQLAGEIEFHDMTMIFETNEDILYNDTACHLNQKGYAIFAEEIGRIIANAVVPRRHDESSRSQKTGKQSPPPYR